MSHFLRKLWKQKPKQWGGASAVRRAIAENAEKIYGINPSAFRFISPLWSKYIYNYAEMEGFYGVNVEFSRGNIDFNGTSAYSEIAPLRFNPPLTILTKIKRRSSEGSYNGIITAVQDGGGWGGFGLFGMSDGRYRAQAESSYSEDVSTTDAYPEDIDISLCLRATQSSYAIYIDGEKASFDKTIGTNYNPTSLDTFHLAKSTASTELFDGIMNYAIVLDDVLSQSQVAYFSDNPYGLFAPIAKPVYFIPTVVGGTIQGVCTEAFAWSDSSSKTAIFRAEAVESIAFSDDDNSLATFAASITDVINITDATINFATLQSSVTDLINITDNIGLGAVLAGIITDTLNVSDSSLTIANLQGILTESLNINDSTSLGAIIVGLISESFDMSDNFISSATLQSSASDNVVVSEDLDSNAIRNCIALDNINFSDATSLGAIISAIISDSLSFSDSTIINANFNVEVTDNLHLIETLSNIARLQAVIIENLGLHDVVVESSTLPSGKITISFKTSKGSIGFNVSMPKITIK